MRTGTPYIPNVAPEVSCIFVNILGSQVGSTYTNADRLVFINTVEEPYTGHATIRLLNQDQGLNGIDFRGAVCAISWAWDGGTGSIDQPYWVVSQKDISKEGKLVVEFKLLAAWELLEHSRGINVADDSDISDPAYGSDRIWERDTTILDIISEIIAVPGGFLEQWGLDTVTQLTDDGIIDVYEPFIDSRLNDSDQMLLRRLLQMTESVITFRATTGTTVNWIDDSLPGPYYTYDIPAVEHPFFVHLHGDSIVIPNKIFYVDQEPDIRKSQVPNFVGSAELATFPLGQFAKVEIDPSIGFPHNNPPTGGEITAGNAEATLRAESHLKRLQMEAVIGELYVPMNCCAELYDEIEILDTRLGISAYGRIGQIERTFQASANDINTVQNQRDTYACTIILGGIGGGSTRIKSTTGSINDIDVTISDLKSRSSSNPFVDSPQYNGSALSQHLAPIIFRKGATANTDFASGTIGDITGATYTFSIPQSGVLHLTVNALVRSLTLPANGDLFYIFVDVDGSNVTGPILFSVLFSDANQNYIIQTASRTLLIDLDAGSHTVKLRGQRNTGATTWRVLGGLEETDMVGFVTSNKLASGAV